MANGKKDNAVPSSLNQVIIFVYQRFNQVFQRTNYSDYSF